MPGILHFAVPTIKGLRTNLSSLIIFRTIATTESVENLRSNLTQDVKRFTRQSAGSISQAISANCQADIHCCEAAQSELRNHWTENSPAIIKPSDYNIAATTKE